MAVASDITLPVFGCRRAEVYVSLGGRLREGLRQIAATDPPYLDP
jgi:hypothetical protein